eukprot:563440-Heterocapsa_arctica.AAC.1
MPGAATETRGDAEVLPLWGPGAAAASRPGPAHPPASPRAPACRALPPEARRPSGRGAMGGRAASEAARPRWASEGRRGNTPDTAPAGLPPTSVAPT